MSFIKYIADESHYKEVLSLVEKAKRTVWSVCCVRESISSSLS